MAIRLEAIAIGLEAIAVRLEAIAIGLEAIAIRLEAIAVRLEAIAIRLEDIAIRCGPDAGGRTFNLSCHAPRECVAMRLRSFIIFWKICLSVWA